MASERPSVDDGYLIKQDAQVVDRVTTYDEAIKRGKAIKRRTPGSKVEIMLDGIAAEIPGRT